jgi:hypothetical protein
MALKLLPLLKNNNLDITTGNQQNKKGKSENKVLLVCLLRLRETLLKLSMSYNITSIEQERV